MCLLLVIVFSANMMMMMMIAVVFCFVLFFNSYDVPGTVVFSIECFALKIVQIPYVSNLGQEKKNLTASGQVRIKTNFLPLQIVRHFYGYHFHSASVTLQLLCTRCKEDVVNTF